MPSSKKKEVVEEVCKEMEEYAESGGDSNLPEVLKAWAKKLRDAS